MSHKKKIPANPKKKIDKKSTIDDALFVVVSTEVENIIQFCEDGDCIVNLDGYAIVPIDLYKTKCSVSNVPPETDASETIWPCNKCGLMPTSEGHDPCIANLPGVIHACCGHGKSQGYVMFENRTVLRGVFEKNLPVPNKLKNVS